MTVLCPLSLLSLEHRNFEKYFFSFFIEKQFPCKNKKSSVNAWVNTLGKQKIIIDKVIVLIA